MSNRTVVIFRKFKPHLGGDVIALFPFEINYPDGSCESYQHTGQHGAATYNHCMDITVPCSEVEYSSLKRELESIGYDLVVRRRRGVNPLKEDENE